MPLLGFEPTISAGEQPLTYALDRAATGTGKNPCTSDNKISVCDPNVDGMESVS